MEPFGNRTAGSGRARSTRALDNLQAGLRERLEALVRDNQRLKQSARMTRDLLDALARLGEITDLTVLCEQAVQTFIGVFTLRGAAISVVEARDAGRLSLARHQGWEAVEPDDLVFEADSSLVAALREEKKPLLVPALVGKTGPRSKERSVLRRLECELVVPLARGDRVLGVLLLTRRADGAPWSAAEIKLLTIFSSFFPIVIENILLRKA